MSIYGDRPSREQASVTWSPLDPGQARFTVDGQQNPRFRPPGAASLNEKFYWCSVAPIRVTRELTQVAISSAVDGGSALHCQPRHMTAGSRFESGPRILLSSGSRRTNPCCRDWR